VVTAAMVRAMQARGLFQSVVVFDGRGTPEGLLTGMIDHLEEVDRGSEVGLSAQLIDLRTGALLWQGAASNNAKLEQRSVPGMVTEMSRDVGNLVEGLVSSMQDRLSTHARTEQ